jgi:uncharacterized protein
VYAIFTDSDKGFAGFPAGDWGMKIGLVSDTHGYVDPQLSELLADVDAILHAGDVGSGEVLSDLGRVAKVHAVRGNVDPAEADLPPSFSIRFENLHVLLQHQLAVPQEELEEWADGGLLPNLNPERRAQFLASFEPGTNVIAFGHSHRPCLVTVGHILFFNPGSSGKKRFTLPRCLGLLETFPRGVRGSIISLEGKADGLPACVWLPLKE